MLRHSYSFSVMTLVCAMLAGCAVGPDYKRPDAPVPKAFKEATDAMPTWSGDWKTAEPQDAAGRPEWWHVFNDPALDDLIAQVQVSNEKIQAADAIYRQAMAKLASSRSRHFPTVEAKAGVSRAPSKSSGHIDNEHNVTLSGKWEIDIWGNVRRNAEAAEAEGQSRQANLASTLLSAQATLAENYFSLRVADAKRALLDRTVADYAKSLQLVRNQYEAGTVQRSDVLQSKTQLKSAQAQQLDIQISRAKLEHSIAILVGKPPSELNVPPADTQAPVPVVPVAVPSQMLERRPDISAAERRMASANANIGVAQAAYYPKLSLSATTGLTASTLARWLSLPDHLWSIGAGLAGTVFDGGLRNADKAKAVAVYDQEVANYRQTVLEAFREVEDNLASARVLEQEATIQGDALRSAREALLLVNNRYKAGTASLLDVLTVQTTAYTAETTTLQIMDRQYTAAVTLIKALGGGWHGYDVEVGKVEETASWGAPPQ
ncbi:efflux transporter outer membrane subunit [Cupriavidus consociatus]|uniref:efflux transporter outer membrane subunit n=1 Tax=Cupriavidus consociatus TaxID=2821357 RepID=UPI001AE4B655|nr:MULTISPECIES: efflux transporter outer membrane subunit [unclassified Cupriavidus]MBP0625352.1 efflux transporter outer membrane subunit [Cupriavidus sp. LEh25]MDK2662090.1 efflux transporter outer membrane subunit [Cupriavidus sp. LEh21]